MTPFTINSACKPDVPILLAMIRELAEFERLAHELEVTADSLRAALFGESPVAAALLARVDGNAAGYAVYYHTFSTFVGRPGIFLDDIYVRLEFRKRGIARCSKPSPKSALSAVADVSSGLLCVGMKTPCVSIAASARRSWTNGHCSA
jgi:GNAT superfamily N-acetyltransferase